MEVILSQSEFAQALHSVSKSVPNRPAHPIMINVLLEADNESIRVTGYDLSLGIQVTIPASVTTAGVTAIPYRLLSEIVSKLPSDSPLSLRVFDEIVTITSTSGSYELSTANPEDFPDFPKISGSSIKLPSVDFARATKAVSGCASTDESKQNLMGVNIRGDGTTVKCAATDGHRLGVASFEAAGHNIDLTIPATSLAEAVKLSDGDIVLTQANTQLLIETGDTRIVTSAFATTFPNYGQLIPPKFSKVATIDRKSFIASVNRVATVAAITNNVVKLTFSESNQQLKISADAEGSKGSELLPIEFTGDDVVIAFNARYLTDALKGLSGDKVVLSMNTETTPAVATNEDNEDQLYLIMPIQVRQA
jgi:DNA polymerase-3 subunit beta